MKILPSIHHPEKRSTATCANVFEELESALMLLNLRRDELNPVQRELASRFVSTCETFAHHMLAADGDSNALCVVLGLPPLENAQFQRNPIITEEFKDGVKDAVEEAVPTADAHGLPKAYLKTSRTCPPEKKEPVEFEATEQEARLTVDLENGWKGRPCATTVEQATQTQVITVHDGWYCEQTLSLPRGLMPSFTAGYKFHVDSSYAICPGWRSDNANRNYILEHVEYDGDEASTCMSSERDLADSEKRRAAGRLRDKAVAQAKALIKAGQGAFDMATLDAMIKHAQEHLAEATFEEFCKYVARVPSRLAPHVGDYMLNGKSFEKAVELGSVYLHSATQKKLDSLLGIRKNRRGGTSNVALS